MYVHILRVPSFLSVYVTTAANPYESSYACYYDGKAGEVYLGDVYSIKWMEDIDQVKLAVHLAHSDVYIYIMSCCYSIGI